MDRRTHQALDPELTGTPVELGEGRATVVFEATPAMAADDTGLVHGGFLFGLADHAAMLAVNHPNVVLSTAEVRFLRPVVVGARLEARARVVEEEGKRAAVEVEVVEGEAAETGPVMTGTFHCVTPSRHVLTPRS